MGNNLENNMKSIKLLTDLIKVSNDRVKAYKRALAALRKEDEDLRPLFTEMILESHKHKAELSLEVSLLGGDQEIEHASCGKIASSWQDRKTMFTGSARGKILRNCEVTEVAVQEAYETAMKCDGINNGLRVLFAGQKSALNGSNNYIHFLRNHPNKYPSAFKGVEYFFTEKGSPPVT